jgi:GT2 family glycosyltransferase
LDGIKIGVTSSFEITHESVGQPNQEFFVSKDKFLEKYGDKLPLDLKPSEVYVPNVKVKNVKINGKVAVIIPTKGKLDLLFQCIESFYDYCDVKLFDIFIADTGSSEEEIKVIEEFVGEVGNIKLIKYDYYNFAKINNDVVKNHIGKEYQYLLFCNNDIKLLSDVISGMLDVFKEKPKVGTVGCRLHYEDNTIQYDGIDIFFKLSQNKLLLDSINKNSYYNFGNNIETSLGNIGLMMINKNTFTQIGMFNESYTDLSDVELNLNFVIKGFNNYVLGTHPVYMFSTKIIDSLSDEFKNNLFPFIQKNSSKLKSQIKQIH